MSLYHLLIELMPRKVLDITVTDDGDARNTAGSNTATHTAASQTSTGPHTILCLTYYSTNPGTTVSSGTWNGVTMSILHQFNYNDGVGGVGGGAIMYISGAQSGDIVINYSAVTYGTAFTKLSLANLVSSTPVDTDSNTGTGTGRTLSALASPGVGGVRIAVRAGRSNSTSTWSNATEVSDYAPEIYWTISAAYDLGNDSGNITATSTNETSGVFGVSLR